MKKIIMVIIIIIIGIMLNIGTSSFASGLKMETYTIKCVGYDKYTMSYQMYCEKEDGTGWIVDIIECKSYDKEIESYLNNYLAGKKIDIYYIGDYQIKKWIVNHNCYGY